MAETKDSAFATMSVLVVDDDAYQRKFVQESLKRIGLTDIRQAESAAAALRAIDSSGKGFDIVICDIDMPDMDGMEFLRLLSERGSLQLLAERRTEPAVLIHSSMDASILRSVGVMAQEYGLAVLGAIQKPASQASLREALTARLERPQSVSGGGAIAMSAEEILRGLEHRQFEPFFQPKVELRSRRVRAAEALARWRHPERGILPPGHFIGQADRLGLLDKLTWVMLEGSAARVRQWNDAGLDISVSVNFSLSSLSDTQLPGRILDLMTRHGVPPERLIVEVTESMAMTDIAHCLETLSRLRVKRFGLSIDDFGTGHSSLQQLSRVPYTELKIDRAFVTGAWDKPHLRAVAESSVVMAQKLGLKTVGEGVETLQDWNYLHELNCDIAQGYHIGKPMEGDRFVDWARDWERNGRR